MAKVFAGDSRASCSSSGVHQQRAAVQGWRSRVGIIWLNDLIIRQLVRGLRPADDGDAEYPLPSRRTGSIAASGAVFARRVVIVGISN